MRYRDWSGFGWWYTFYDCHIIIPVLYAHALQDIVYDEE